MPRILMIYLKSASTNKNECDKPTHMDQEKITEIETMLAYQEQQITEMSDVITDQWKTIDLLKRKLNKLEAKIEQGSDDSQSGEQIGSIERARQDIPPHY